MMEGYLPLPIKQQTLSEIVEDAKDFIFGSGIVIRSIKNPTSADAIVHAPFTLFPSPVIRSCFQEAVQVQEDMNLLMHFVANDPEFLKESLKSVIRVDDFTQRLWNIHESVRNEGITPKITLAINRSDYMMGSEEEAAEFIARHSRTSTNASKFSSTHSISASERSSRSSMGAGHSHRGMGRRYNLRQIEFNTIAASFAGLSQNLTAYHRYFLARNNLRHAVRNIPENQAADGIAEALITAWQLYSNQDAVILFLTYAVERNIYDQRQLEYSVYAAEPTVKIIRRTLKDVQARGHLTHDRKLMVDGMEVAIVYQRCCYKPADFTSDADWDTRLMIERSQAVVCPNIGYHLAGTKKVQQVLAQPGVVEKFIEDPLAVRRIRATFADQFSLDMNEEGEANVEMAIQRPDLFVLKPQREGGGNNYFGDSIRAVLEKIKDCNERSSYILMRRIHPMVIKNYPIASDQPVNLIDMVSELGVFGTLVADGPTVIFNKQQGCLLRTKQLGTDEGGVATGYSVLDTPLLVEQWPPSDPQALFAGGEFVTSVSSLPKESSPDAPPSEPTQDAKSVKSEGSQ